jgi:hypothetical protein
VSLDPIAIPSASSPHRPGRAPALYVVGFAHPNVEAETAFRLPCPPRWDDAPLGTAAAELRIRKAYLGTLDALRTGCVEPQRLAKLRRLTREVRSESARVALDHLCRVQRFVRWSGGGWPVIPAPEVPLDRIVVTAPVSLEEEFTDAELAHRYAWTLDWMRMHRWTVGRGLLLEWRLYEKPPTDSPAEPIVVAVEPEVRSTPASPPLDWPIVRA